MIEHVQLGGGKIGDGKPGSCVEFHEGSNEQIVVFRNSNGSPAFICAANDYAVYGEEHAVQARAAESRATRGAKRAKRAKKCQRHACKSGSQKPRSSK